MQRFQVVHNPQVYHDIQFAVDYYKEQTGNSKLGKRLVNNVEIALSSLEQSALHYQIRYDDIRLLPIPTFPFRAHYRVDEVNLMVFVEAVFHTSINPAKWKSRNSIH